MGESLQISKPRYILAADLDGTLIGDRQALEEFNSFMKKRRKEFLLVYVTGRKLSSVQELMKEEELLNPDVLIVDVGTEIYLAHDYLLELNWDKRVSVFWNSESLKARFASIKGLYSQGIYPRYRLAYFTDKDMFKKIVTQMKNLVEKERLPVEIIPSMGHIIDVIPIQAGKGKALKYIQEMYAVPKEYIFACGDSENDISMLTAGFKGIVVGNCQLDLKEVLAQTSETIYFSKAFYARGVLEGIKKYGIA